MDRADLSGALLKVDRAKTHLDDFDAQARLITQECRSAIISEPDEQHSEQVFRFGRVPAVPPVLSAIIGDAIHNLRVSLDHLAWQLVIAAGREPDVRTSFPIHKAACRPDARGCTYPQISPGVPMLLREMLDEVQPYKREKPAYHDLAVLHALDISDKHHGLLVAIIGVRSIGWFGEAEPHQFNPGPYNDGAEVCRFAYLENEVKPIFDFDVRLCGPGVGPLGLTVGAADLVRRLLRYVEDQVLPRFRAGTEAGA